MKTKFLRFPNEAAFTALLPKDFVRSGETGSPLPQGITAMRIWPGEFSRRGEYGEEDEKGKVKVVKPPKVSPGCHVNVRGELPQSWRPFEVFPKQAMCVFGGEED